jgi:hypothetical protein
MLLNICISLTKIAIEIFNICMAISLCNGFIAALLCFLFMVLLHSGISLYVLDYFSNGQYRKLAEQFLSNSLTEKNSDDILEDMQNIKLQYGHIVLLAFTVISVVLSFITP